VADPDELDRSLRAATAATFDRLDSDGCMSTNDTVLLMASGASGVVFQPDRLNVAINGIWVCRHGAPGDERSKVDLRPKDVTITVDLSAGPHSAIILTTDLTTAYVHENSAYST